EFRRVLFRSLLRVGRAGGTATRAEVVLIALADRRPAVDRARLEQVVRTRAREARAELGQVARAGGGATGRAGVAGRMLAGVARPVARVAGARIAVVGARRPARLLGVGRAVGAVPGAEIVQIAFADRRAAECQRRLERVVRARRAAARARLGDVADAHRRAARGSRVAGRMLTRIADPVASIGRADVAVVRARRPARLLRIGRAVRAGARTVLGEVALPRRRAAGEGDRLEGVVRTR